MKIEEEDAEALINDIDLDFECFFDTNLLLGRRKQSSSQGTATGLVASSSYGNGILQGLRVHKLSSSEDKRERDNSSQGNLMMSSSHGAMMNKRFADMH